jgi:hypothetical protein
MHKVSLTGNSLAYLLCQKPVTLTNRRPQMHKVSLIGNSLAYLLCQKQKRATVDVRVVSKREA